MYFLTFILVDLKKGFTRVLVKSLPNRDQGKRLQNLNLLIGRQFANNYAKIKVISEIKK
jgi:hypothetical protein